MIGIAGFGFVGQAVYGSIFGSYLKDGVYIYDKYKNMGNSSDLFSGCNVIFCCLPTVDDGSGKQNFDEYNNFLQSALDEDFEGILVVKSTVLYENLEPWTQKLNIVMNPEFLNQNSAVEDFKNQGVIVLGGRIDHCREVEKAYFEYFELQASCEVECCTLKEAIELKYMHNIYHAYKVLFWNYVEEKTGNSRKVSDLYHKVSDRNELSRVCADGKPGYGGACFPKDVNAMNNISPHILTSFMVKYNTILRDNQP
jgi:UDPglucose 6-dehydrogenase